MQYFGKYSNLKFRDNPFSVRPVVPRGRTDRQPEVAKLMVAFSNLAKGFKNSQYNWKDLVFKPGKLTSTRDIHGLNLGRHIDCPSVVFHVFSQGLHANASIIPSARARQVPSANLPIHYDMIYLLTAIGLTPGDSSTVHIYTQTIHRTTQ